MSELFLRLAPFAPDQSGAVSVLFEMGGIVIICDAGGCTGNICGYDEPRWRLHKSALFSAALRDMDAILGRDERLVSNLLACVDSLHADFVALVGTPVPAVIGTDFTGLSHLAEKRCGLPVISIPCTGTKSYDAGQELALLTLLRRFADEKSRPVKGRIGVLGATPLDLSIVEPSLLMRDLREEFGEDKDFVVYGMGSGLEAIRAAGSCEYNLVVSPSGIAAAKLLKNVFGTAWKLWYPHTLLPGADFAGSCLMIHQAVATACMRAQSDNKLIQCATFFAALPPSFRGKGDVQLRNEHELRSLICQGEWQTVIADRTLKKAVPEYAGRWIDMPHFAVSGRLHADKTY